MDTTMDMITATTITTTMRINRIASVFAAASVLALSSCNAHEESPGDFIYMWFEVSGKVVDASGFPIEGISVIAESAEVVVTGTSGTFKVQGGGVPAESTSIRFVDSDDKEPKYIPQTVAIDLEKFKEGHGWNEGYYRNRGEVVVKMAEEAMITPPTSDVETRQGEEQ